MTQPSEVDMKIGILSDIHGNLEALRAMADHLRGEGAQAFWCLGDIVGYGPNPNECMEFVWELCPPDPETGRRPIILGNHDEAAIGGDITAFNLRARQAALWTRDRLSVENHRRLEALPMRANPCAEVLLVHSSPRDPERWIYVLSAQEAEKAFQSFHEPLCFIGHSHSPFVAMQHEEEVRFAKGRSGFFEPEERYLVNVGSVGQPRDRDPRACAVLFDRTTNAYSFERCTYDIAAVQRKILEEDLPEILATRLEHGM